VSVINLHNAVNASTGKLFFVQYTPAGTIRPPWYLIQIDTISTAELPQWEETGDIFVSFSLDIQLIEIGATNSRDGGQIGTDTRHASNPRRFFMATAFFLDHQ